MWLAGGELPVNSMSDIVPMSQTHMSKEPLGLKQKTTENRVLIGHAVVSATTCGIKLVNSTIIDIKRVLPPSSETLRMSETGVKVA
jgi:hypothetical protein